VTPVPFAVKAVELFLRSVPLRTPFRFGDVTLRESRHVVARVTIEHARHGRAVGLSSDFLAPRWFDKSPLNSEQDNIRDLIRATQWAARTVLAFRTEATLFDHWFPLQKACAAEAARHGLPALVGAFGSASIEKALFDALGGLTRQAFHAVVRSGAAGIDPGRIHPELKDRSVADWIPEVPAARVHIRHTVGMLDPLDAAEAAASGAADDGLPRSLTEYLQQDGIRYFKVKIGGNPRQDVERVLRIAEVVERARGRDYAVTLDGNEQYRNPDDLVAFFEALAADPRGKGFLANTLFVEQPIPRELALQPGIRPTLERIAAWLPAVLDEGDDALDAFRRARQAGWRGVTAKTCKGVIKALLNLGLVRMWSSSEVPLLLSAEDLTAMPVLGLHQELTTVATLGLAHVEKNGHHYARGCDHCTPQELEGVTRIHGSLYRPLDNGKVLDIQAGQVDLRSLQVPGYGVGFEVDCGAFERCAE
jgi:hypothetical protein